MKGEISAVAERDEAPVPRRALLADLERVPASERRQHADLVERGGPLSLERCNSVLRLDSFFSGAPCASSGGRLPEALFMVFQLDSKGAEVRRISVNFVDLVKSFHASIFSQKSASIQPRTGLSKFAEN